MQIIAGLIIRKLFLIFRNDVRHTVVKPAGANVQRREDRHQEIAGRSQDCTCVRDLSGGSGLNRISGEADNALDRTLLLTYHVVNF